ncbi:MAG: DUF485 domain-containing protein [Thermodesulfovibrionales bacterium]|nr:DUF485 domain-containing protein [Thermodesulfovibrionales bacterium]
MEKKRLSKSEILEDEDFKQLVKKKNMVSMVFTILELILYFGFVGLIAYNKPFLSQKISEDSAMTIGIPIAVLTIFFSWVLTAIYIFWANSSYDNEVKKVKDKIGG